MFQRFAIDALPATPWKNGGGNTREIVCQPLGADMDGFDWRVSIATIAQAGPFSAFAGVDRVIMLLDGAGVHLHGAGVEHRLDVPLRPFAFSGDVALGCDVLGAVSTDFNVMTRRGVLHADVQVLHAACDVVPAEQGLLLAWGGAWSVQSIPQRSEMPKVPWDSDKLLCAAGCGGWWQGRAQGWRVQPRSADSALVVVRLVGV